MNYNLEMLRNMSCQLSEVQIHHVQRKENTLADLMANHGVKQEKELMHQLWENQMGEVLRRKCLKILEQD